MTDQPDVHLPVVTATTALQVSTSPLVAGDRHALAKAVHALEYTNLATRIANSVGKQLGSLGRLLPSGVSDFVNGAAEKAIERALSVALGSLKRDTVPMRRTRLFHKTLAAMSGAAGGVFGLASLPIELPISTIIILRSIADIARMEGEDLSDPAVALACLEVFALGAHEDGDDFTDGGYFAVRGLLAKSISDASRYAIERGANQQAAPILVRVVSQIASRFGIVVSEKLAAQAIPVIGAAGGAAVNVAFVSHFQSIAYGHFTVRRLERLYGGEIVRAEYQRMRQMHANEALA